jgi:hypothetical protein
MATQGFIQASLAGGEIAPALYGRADLARYLTSLKLEKNFVVQPYGGAKNRAGTQYVGKTRDSAKYARLLPFIFSTQQTFVLEFGDYYMRLFTQSGQVILQPATIAAIAAYAAGTTYGLADHCSYNGTYYYSKTAGNIGHQPDTSPTYWLALTGVLVEIPTPWKESDLDLLKYTQSADVLTITHPKYPPQNITRLAVDKWTCTEAVIELGPFEDLNEDTAVTIYASAATGTGITLTASSSIFKSTDVGRLVKIVQKNAGKAWVSNTAVALNDIRRADSKYYKATNAGTTGYTYPTNDANTWDDGGVVWQYLHGGFGIAKITGYTSGTVVTATVVRYIPDACVGSGNTTYIWAKGAWCSENGYPGCTTYHQQRLVFAGSTKDPQTVWLSTTADFANFGESSPVVDKDALVYPLDGRMVSAVKHVLTMGANLVAFSSDSEWSLSAPNDGALTQTDVSAKLQGYRGSADLMPLVVGDMAIYVQSKGQVVRDLGYDYLKNVFTGIDLTMYASHLVENHTIIDWAFQQTPFSTVWCVREDGVLLSLTYVKDQEVMGWAQHTTDGYFESICCVSEGQEDALYMIVYREIDGVGQRYVERMANRVLTTDIMSAWFLDCGLSYDGTNMGSTTVTVTESSGGWDETAIVQIESSSPIFNTGSLDLDDSIIVNPDSGRYEIIITEVVDTSHALGTPQKLIDPAWRSTATTDWAFARRTLSGADHLEGKSIGILADGNVHPEVTVTGGVFSMDTPAVRLIVGLPYNSDMETLDLAAPGGQVIQDTVKNIPCVHLQLEGSRGVMAGPSFDKLQEYKQRTDEGYYESVRPMTGMAMIQIPTTWTTGGHVCIRQPYPLPLAVQAIIPEVELARR